MVQSELLLLRKRINDKAAASTCALECHWRSVLIGCVGLLAINLSLRTIHTAARLSQARAVLLERIAADGRRNKCAEFEVNGRNGMADFKQAQRRKQEAVPGHK